MKQIKDVLEEIKKILKTKDKTIYTFNEGCDYCGISGSSMYKLTSTKRISFSKPEGKLIYFKKEDLDAFMLRNRQATLLESEGLNKIKTSKLLKNSHQNEISKMMNFEINDQHESLKNNL